MAIAPDSKSSARLNDFSARLTSYLVVGRVRDIVK